MLHLRELPGTRWGCPRLIAACASLLLVSSLQVCAAEQNVDVPLTYRAFFTTDGMVDTSLGGLRFSARALKQGAQGYRLPTGWTRATLFTFTAPGRTGQVAAVNNVVCGGVTRSPMLYIDWNGDKRFTSDEALKGSQQSGTRRLTRFGPVQRAKADGSKAPSFCIVMSCGHQGGVVPAGLYEGQATLGGKAVKIGLIDRNLNGRLGESGGDVVLIDFDGNGIFRGGQSDGYGVTGDQEALSLGQMMQLPDGHYYRASVADGTTSLTLAQDPTPLGRVRVGCSRSFFLLNGPQGPLMVRGSADEVAVPAGSYRLQSLTLSEKDAAGKYWSVFVRPNSQAPLQVGEGQTVALNGGLPLKLGVSISTYRTGRWFSVSLTDRAGNEVYDVRTPQGGRPPVPVLRVATADGKVLKQTSFSYG